MMNITEANQFLIKKSTWIMVPLVIAICAIILFTNYSRGITLVFLVISGLTAGFSVATFMTDNVKKSVMTADDPNLLINQRIYRTDIFAIMIIVIAAIILKFI